jgi:hypothetical protein
MEQIIVEWYSHETNEIMETEVRCFGLIEAIEIVRSSNNYKVVCLGAKYKDKESLISGIKKINSEKVL